VEPPKSSLQLRAANSVSGSSCTTEGAVVEKPRFFGDNGRGHIRLTFVSEPEERIELGFKKVADFVSSGKS
jgi:aspartate/methionine/tyrosine aminotransferase